MLSVFVALHPMNTANGTLEVLKGSNQMGRLDHHMGETVLDVSFLRITFLSTIVRAAAAAAAAAGATRTCRVRSHA